MTSRLEGFGGGADPRCSAVESGCLAGTGVEEQLGTAFRLDDAWSRPTRDRLINPANSLADAFAIHPKSCLEIEFLQFNLSDARPDWDIPVHLRFTFSREELLDRGDRDSISRRPGLEVRRSVRLVALAALCAGTGISPPLLAQSPELQVVIAADAPCRSEPAFSAPVVMLRGLGERFEPRDRHSTGGDTWIFDSTASGNAPTGCWISESMTRDWADREAALPGAADWILERTDEILFEEFVAVDNFLLEARTRDGRSTIFERFPLVQLKRLQLVQRATEAPDAWLVPVREDLLESAWFRANRDILSYFEPGGQWIVESEAFWRLYAAHRHAEWAEEIAWAAAQGMIVQAECDGPCRLEGLLMTFARYWTEFPDGRWVEQALVRAEADLASSADWCEYRGPEEVRQIADRVRVSLKPVRAPGVDRVRDQTAAIVEACGGHERP